MSKSLSKSVEKVLSSSYCKICCCVLLVGMFLFILNRFSTQRNKETFLGFNSSNRAENEYRRVKLKYGRQKLRKMGLDPNKYSEDFIFTLLYSFSARLAALPLNIFLNPT